MVYKLTKYLLVFFLLPVMNIHAQQKPNIVIIVADDLGWNDVGFHNPEMITPHMNAFTEKGIELERFYVGALCSPTRAGIMTGKLPDRFGLRGVVGPRAIGGLPTEEKTIADIFGDAGYTKRGAFGKWHLGHSDVKYHPLSRGFTHFYGHYNGAIDYFTHYRNGALDWHDGFKVSKDTGYSMDLITERAVDFINHSADEPFLAYVALNAPHTPLQGKKEDLALYGFDPSKPIGNYDGGGYQASEHNGPDYGERGRGNNARQTYAAMVTAMDRAVGDIMKALEQNGLLENTIIWFTSDNGGDLDFGASNLPLRGEKSTEWEGGVRAISLIYWKGKWEGGKVNKQVMGYIDMLPTLASVAGIALQNEMDGIDVSTALNGRKLKRKVFFLGKDAIVSKKWKLNKGELFRIEKDVDENNDLAAKHPGKLRKMNIALDDFKKIVAPNKLKFHPVTWKPVSWNIIENSETRQ